MPVDPFKAPAADAGAGATDPRASETDPRNVSDAEARSPRQEPQANGASPNAGPAEEGQQAVGDDEQPGDPVDDQPAESAATEPDAGQPDEPAEAYALAGEELQALTERAARAEEYLALAQRTQADFENYRRRAARDAAIAKERGATQLARELLPAVDNLERALAHAPEDDTDDGFTAGVRHVHSDVVAALQRVGIEPYSPEGESFDPQLHEAVAQQPVDGCASGTVVEVLQRGYRIGDTVLRPARVVVAG